MRYYTITEASEELAIPRNKVLHLVRSGQVASTKGKEKRSPYKIAQTELKKLLKLATSEDLPEEKEQISTKDVELVKNAQEEVYKDVVQMQKLLMETMRSLAETQDKIASTLAYLAKKL